jgi:hypothetical protein
MGATNRLLRSWKPTKSMGVPGSGESRGVGNFTRVDA